MLINIELKTLNLEATTRKPGTDLKDYEEPLSI